jgi:hypothetical protein
MMEEEEVEEEEEEEVEMVEVVEVETVALRMQSEAAEGSWSPPS